MICQIQSMEKRRSPRSSKRSGPSIFPKSPLVYESYKSGCGWKLINLFDFGHVKSSNKRLGSEKKKVIRDSAGNVYTKSQLDLLKRLHEKCQCNDRIVEEESSCKPKTRSRSFSSDREHDKCESKPVQGLLEREIRRIKSLKEETYDFSDKQKQSSLSEIEKTSGKDKLMDLKNGRDCKKSAEINLQVCVNEAAESLICSKAEGKGKDRSKQFKEALDILNSNKELFITLLQDPNSFSEKKGLDLEGSKVKELRAKSPSMADDLDRIVLLKPRLASSVDDKVYLRFKHLAKKLKLVVGSNKDSNHAENKPEGRGKARETEAASFRTSDVSTSTVGRSIPESPVFRRKKRVESDVFKLSVENDVLPRRFMVERQQERSTSSPVYEVPYALSSLQAKLKERRQKLEKKRESFNLCSLDKNFEIFDPNPYNSNLRSLDSNCTDSSEYRSLRTHVEDRVVEERCLESSLGESSWSIERRDINGHDSKQEQESSWSIERRDINGHDSKQEQEQEQEQPSPVSVLERIYFEDEIVNPGNVKISKLEEQIGLSFDDPNIDLVEKDSVLEFLKKVLEASRLNWTNFMARCSKETSLLDEFSRGNHNNDQLLLVLDYADEILREIYHQDIKFWPFTPSDSSRVVNLQLSLREEDLIHETMRRFDWSLLCVDSPPTTLDQIIETDLMKPCLCSDFGGESEGVLSDVAEMILKQLVLEISHELRTMQRSIVD